MVSSIQAAAIGSLTVEIGGIPLALLSENASFDAMVIEKYAGYIRPAGLVNFGQPPLQFKVDIVPDGRLRGDEEVSVWKEDGAWHARRGDFHATFNIESGCGTIREELNAYGLNSVLRIVHSIYLAAHGGFLLHAASAVRNGKAFIFSGVSGAGKTTISRCAPGDAVLLTDEISYIRRLDSDYCAWGTPFAGDLGTSGENVSAPIAKLFFLEKGPYNKTVEMLPEQAIGLLLRNVLFFCHDEELVSQVFDSVIDFLKRVPVFRLTFVPDASVWALIG